MIHEPVILSAPYHARDLLAQCVCVCVCAMSLLVHAARGIGVEPKRSRDLHFPAKALEDR